MKLWTVWQDYVASGVRDSLASEDDAIAGEGGARRSLASPP